MSIYLYLYLSIYNVPDKFVKQAKVINFSVPDSSFLNLDSPNIV